MAQKIRYGIIGFGNFAERRILPAIQASPNAELVAIQKRSFMEAQTKANQYKIPLAFDSAEKLAQHQNVDAVYVASAVCNHAADTIAAARAGKHVLVEKPMAMNAAEAETMINACNEHGVKLMVAHDPLLAVACIYKGTYQIRHDWTNNICAGRFHVQCENISTFVDAQEKSCRQRLRVQYRCTLFRYTAVCFE